MGKRVDTEGGLLDEQKSENASIHQTTLPITPTQASDDHWEYHTEEQNDLSVVSVLPDNDRVFVQVRDLRSAFVLRVLIQDHPHEVCIPSPLHHTIWVLGCVGPSVMRSVLAAPPSDRSLHGTTTGTSQEYSQR